MPAFDASPRDDDPEATLLFEGSLPSSTTGSEDPASGVVKDAAAGAPPAVARSSFLALFSAVMLPMFMGGVDQTLYGRMGDRFGRRNVMLVALAIFMLGSLACGFAPTMPLLIGARVLQGAPDRSRTRSISCSACWRPSPPAPPSLHGAPPAWTCASTQSRRPADLRRTTTCP